MSVSKAKKTTVKSARGPKQGSARSNQSVKLSADQSAIDQRIADYKAKDAAPKARQPKAIPVGKTKLAATIAAGLADPKSTRNVVAENKAAKAKATNETNKRKPTQVQSVPDMVPGYPSTPLYKGKDATPRSIAALAAANAGHDTVAILNDGSAHLITRMLGAGLKIKAGQVFSAVCADYAKLQAAEDSKRAAASKGPAVLAKGAETEVHSRKAAADSRKDQPAPKADAKPAPKGGKNKQPSTGQDFAYKSGKAFDRKAGTWTEYMVKLAQAHKGTAEAKAAHAKGKEFTNKKLDFSWMLAQGFIKR